MVEEQAPVTNLAVARIKQLWAKADRLEKTAEEAKAEANQLRWESAEEIAAQLDAGWSQRALAVELGCSPAKVQHYAATWRKYGAYHGMHSFSDAFALVKASATEAETKDIKAEAAATGRSIATTAAKPRGGTKGILADPTPGTHKAHILDAVAAVGADGITSPEIIDRLGATQQQVWYLVKRLADEGWIVDTSTERLSVWKVSMAGAKRLGLPHGWKTATGRAKQARYQGENPEERDQRREREHIRGAIEEERLRLGPAAEFRQYAKWLRQDGRRTGELADLAEKEGCPPSTQEVLVIHLEALVEHATRGLVALKARRPKETTFYDTLRVPHDATADEIKRANRVLVKQYHPDVNPGDAERIHAINVAYDVLSDPEKRWLYNLYGARLRP